MKKIYYVFLTFLAFSFLVTTNAQLKFDVKTKFGEKRQLLVIKAGLISFIEQSDWAKVVEFGEDYSLWIKNLSRVVDGEYVNISLDLELRTPAMFRQGKLIDSRRIRERIDIADAIKVSYNNESALVDIIEQQISRSRNPLLYLDIIAEALPYRMGKLIKIALKIFARVFSSGYSSYEAVEGLVFGATLMENLKYMVRR